MIPMPTQLSGAAWLASKHRAMLADEPRVGKTGAAILAADYILARKIIVVTTSSGRSVWRRAFAEWSTIERSVRVFGADKATDADVTILSWDAVLKGGFALPRDLVILDEAHKAKNPETKRAQSTYGKMYSMGEQMLTGGALVRPEDRVWLLTGTPLPHDPGDLWPHLRACLPERLLADEKRGWPNVTRYDDFRSRYCVIRMKKISNWTKIPVVVGGRNLDELRKRIDGFVLRRTQKDIGIRPPSYDLLPLIVSPAQRKQADGDVDKRKILEAAEAGRTKELEYELGELRRITGIIKAHAVVAVVIDEFEGGLDKIVLMRWHSEIGQILREGLAKFGVVSVDGSTSAKDREAAERAFRDDPNIRVFDGQIKAAGEAIDLSAAAVLWFVETSFSPSDMGQAALRITNVNQTRTPFVRVCTLEGTIDEALQASLMRLWAVIKEVIK
jgi:hypothetical protein